MSKNILLTHKAGVHITGRGPYIVTYSGKKFYPNDVRQSDIDINDIAHALSNQCRFGGHVKYHYSVAQHSCYVSDWLADKDNQGFYSLELRGLLHDASEAYLVDVPRPIKLIADFSTYRTIEKTTQQVIYKKFGLIGGDDPAIVTQADNLLLATEARDLMNNPFWAKHMPKLTMKIKPWTPAKAEREFMERFEKLYV